MAGSGYRDWAAGNVPTAAQFDTYLQEQTVMVFATAAARDTALSTAKSEGMVTYQLDTNTLTIYTGAAWSPIGPAHGAWTSFTPVITQSGVVTHTVSNSTYLRVGRMIHWRFTLTVTGSGTGSNVVTLSVPVNIGYVSDYAPCGWGQILDSSTNLVCAGPAVPAAAGTIKIQTLYMSGSAFNVLGTSSFTAALASGDVISGWCIYEAAAD